MDEKTTVTMTDQFGQVWEFKSIAEAVKRTGIPSGEVMQHLKSGKPVTMGTHEVVFNKVATRSHIRRKVLMVLGGKSFVYPNVSACSRAINRNRDFVIRHIASGTEAIIDHKLATFDYLEEG